MSVGRRDGAPARTDAHDPGSEGRLRSACGSENDGGPFDGPDERLVLSGVGHFQPDDLTSASKRHDLRCEWQTWGRKLPFAGSQILSGCSVEPAVLHADWWNAVIGGNIALWRVIGGIWRATLADFAIFKKCLPANILYCHTNVVDSNRTARSGPPISRAAV